MLQKDKPGTPQQVSPSTLDTSGNSHMPGTPGISGTPSTSGNTTHRIRQVLCVLQVN